MNLPRQNEQNDYRAARDAHGKGDFKKAGRLYARHLKKHPGDPQALGSWAILAFQENKPALAVERLHKAIGFAPDDPTLRLNMSEILRRTGDLEAAREHVLAGLEAAPGNPDLHTNAGAIFSALGEENKAYDYAKMALKLAPTDPLAHFNMGLRLKSLGHFDDAIHHLEEAVRYDNGFADAHAALGTILVEIRCYELALEHLDAALTAGSALTITSRETVLTNKAAALKGLHRAEEATTIMREIVDSEPGNADYAANLANWLESNGATDEAESLANDIVGRNASNLRANLVLARSEIRRGEFAAAAERLEALASVESARREGMVFSSVLFERATALQGLEQFDRAFDCWEEANRFAAAQPAWRRVDERPFWDEIAETRARLSDEGLARPLAAQSSGNDDHFPIFLVGFPRSGTTLLESVMATSPEIEVSDEQPFLAQALRANGLTGRQRDLDSADGDTLARVRASYRERVANVHGHAIAGKRLVDKVPLNICWINWIVSLFPAVKVIVLLRDPRAACFSCFCQNFGQNPGMKPFLSLDGCGKAYGEVMSLWRLYAAIEWLPTFTVRYEDLVASFDDTTKSVFEFAGLEWTNKTSEFFVGAKERYISTPSARAVRAPLYGSAVDKWRNYAHRLGPIIEATAPFVAEFGYE